MTYSERFLISELYRFVDEKRRVPTSLDIDAAYGYPSAHAYKNHFGTYNNGVEIAKLKPSRIRHKLDGTETCSYCGCTIEKTQAWIYDENNVRYCFKHGQRGNPDYVKGNLDINSPKGLGRAGEILVIKTLGIEKRYDCNRISCNYPIDLYHEKYGCLEVKTALLSYNYNRWYFNFDPKKDIDTYICIGLSSNRSNVEYVWLIPNVDEVKNKVGFTIRNGYLSLSGHKKWEIDFKQYNETWKSMKLYNCKIMIDKSKDGYVEVVKHSNIVNNTIKQVEQVIDKAQYRLVDF